MPSARQSAIRLLQLMMVASVVLPAVLFAFASLQSYRHEHTLADDQIGRSLDIIHEHPLKMFQMAERAMAEVEEVVRGMPDDAVAGAQPRLHRRLRQIVDAVPQFQTILVIDRAGRPLASSGLAVIPRDASAADRAYFQAHAAGGEDTLVSETLAPRWGDLREHFFTLSRRRPLLDGSFNGIVSFALLPRYFEEFYALIGRDPGSLYALVRSDGRFLALYSGSGDRARLIDRTSELSALIARGLDRALLTVPSSEADSVERRIGYRRLAGFPVYVATGIEASAIRGQ